MVSEEEGEREPDAPGGRPSWRRAVAGMAHAIDLLPDGLAVGVGLVLGVTLVVAAAVGGWVWVAGMGLGIALALGRFAGVRPRPVGWARPVVGTSVLLGLASGMLGLAVVGWEGGEANEIVLAEGVEAMRLDLGDGGSTSAGEPTAGSDDAGTSSGGEDSSTTTDGAPPPKRVQSRPLVPVPEGDGITIGGDAVADVESDPIDGAEAASCPSDMVLIDGGSFDGHDVQPFCLDVTEVKVSSYERCMTERRCGEAGVESGWVGRGYSKSEYCNRNHKGRGSHPINCVDWRQALDFCAWAGRRLPTEWEWEWAAQGRDEGRTYPWGEEAPTCARAVMRERVDGCGKDRTWYVGSRPKGNSRDGAKDMAGNVWEWTSSKSAERRIVRGGSWEALLSEHFRASRRYYVLLPSVREFDIGFRCARTAGGSK